MENVNWQMWMVSWWLLSVAYMAYNVWWQNRWENLNRDWAYSNKQREKDMYELYKTREIQKAVETYVNRNMQDQIEGLSSRAVKIWESEVLNRELKLEQDIELWNQVDEQPEPTKNYHI